MGIGKGNFTARKGGYRAGYGIVMDLAADLPRKFDGDAVAKGMVLTGSVVSVLGAKDLTAAPQVGEAISVNIRPGDNRKAIFDDLDKTRESRRFLLEGITGEVDALEARWAHGAGGNREVRALEIVGAPHVSFENPIPKDGPRHGFLRLNLDGGATSFDERLESGEWITRELPFATVVERLKAALERGLKFRVVQRVLEPSHSLQVDGQDELEYALKQFRDQGYTSCAVRTFVPGTTDPNMVDMQILNWPQDIPAGNDSSGKTYDMPTLRETKRFAALRDNDDVNAVMEVMPGYESSLVGNPTDSSKSVKHKFVEDICGKGLSASQMNMFAAQAYGPGISIRAVNEDGAVLGLTRLITRTEGPQYRGLMSIPSPAFPDADKIVFKASDKPVEAQDGEEAQPAGE